MTKEKSLASHKDDTTLSTSTIGKDTKDALVDTQYTSEEQILPSHKNNAHKLNHISVAGPAPPFPSPCSIDTSFKSHIVNTIVPSTTTKTVPSPNTSNNKRSSSSMACCAQSSHCLTAASAPTLMNPSRNSIIPHDIVQANSAPQNTGTSTAMASVHAQAVPPSLSSLSSSSSLSKKRVRNPTIPTSATCSGVGSTISDASGVEHNFSPGHVEHKKRKLSSSLPFNTNSDANVDMDVDSDAQTIRIENKFHQGAIETNDTGSTTSVALGPPPPLNSDDDHDHLATSAHVFSEENTQTSEQQQEQKDDDYGQLSLTQIHSFIDNVDIPSYEVKKPTTTPPSLPLSSPSIDDNKQILSNPCTSSSSNNNITQKNGALGTIVEEVPTAAVTSSSCSSIPSTKIATHSISTTEKNTVVTATFQVRINEAPQGNEVASVPGPLSVPIQAPLTESSLSTSTQLVPTPHNPVNVKMNENANISTTQQIMVAVKPSPLPLKTSIQQQEVKCFKPEINVSSIAESSSSTSFIPSQPQQQQLQQMGSSSSFSSNSHSHTNSSNSSKPKTTKSPAKQQPKKSSSSGRWSREEHKAFLEGLKIYGREWKKVAHNIPTRTSAQIRSHAQKYFAKLARDEQQQANMWLSSNGGNIHDSPCAAIGGGGAHGSSFPSSIMSPDRIGLEDSTDKFPPSVLRRVEKIIKDPKGAEKEVEETLKRLRDRYNQLQQKVREKEAAKAAKSENSNTTQRNRSSMAMHSDHGNSIQNRFLHLKEPVDTLRQQNPVHLDNEISRSSQNNEMTPVVAIQPQQQQQQQTIIEQQALENTTMTTTTTRHRLRNDLLASKELIALHVLGGELFRSSSRENLNLSSTNSTDDAAATETEPSSNRSSDDAKEEDDKAKMDEAPM